MTVLPTTRPRHAAFSPWPSLLCAPLGVLAAGLLYGALRLPGAVETFLAAQPILRGPFIEGGLPGLADAVSRCGLVAAAVCFAASLAGFVRRAWALRIVRAACIAGWILGGLYVYAVFCATAVPLARNLAVNGVPATPGAQFFWRWHLMGPAFGVMALLAWLYLLSWRSVVIAVYRGLDALPPAAGDRLLENLRTNGEDPRFRKGLWSSAGIHILVILVIPWLLSMRGCVDPYRVPKGSGTPEVSVAKIVKVVKKQKKKKHLLVNAQSAISFYVPDLDDSKILRQVDDDTQETYRADPNRILSTLGSARAGKMGAGGGKDANVHGQPGVEREGELLDGHAVFRGRHLEVGDHAERVDACVGAAGAVDARVAGGRASPARPRLFPARRCRSSAPASLRNGCRRRQW